MKTGFVAVIGRPNVGKSTLINSILGYKVSIVTNKSQTTRNDIKGIYTDDESQIIFVDTPGIHKPFKQLGEAMNDMAYTTSKDVDVVILVVDAGEAFGTGDEFLIEHININTPLFIVFNKIDTTNILKITALKEKYKQIYPDARVFETVANQNIDTIDVLNALKEILPEGPMYYPEEDITDRDMRFQVKEIIREKMLLLLNKEVPHCSAVTVDSYVEQGHDAHIHATIVVERASHKGIVIGKNGAMIKKIGTLARKDIEEMCGQHVSLELFVKVQEDWRDNKRLLKEYGYITSKK
jgi:GTP-binding protein Era